MITFNLFQFDLHRQSPEFGRKTIFCDREDDEDDDEKGRHDDDDDYDDYGDDYGDDDETRKPK